MKRSSWVWGIVCSVILILISFVLSNMSCSSPFICTNDLIFLILNIPGLVVVFLLMNLKLINQSSSSISHSIAILFSIPFYFLIGILLKKLFRR